MVVRFNNSNRPSLLVLSSIIIVLIASIWLTSTIATTVRIQTGMNTLFEENLVDNNAYITPDGSKAVFVAKSSSGDDTVYVYNFSTSVKIAISPTEGARPVFEYQSQILINNDYFCWFDMRNRPSNTDNILYDVYCVNLSNGNEVRVTSSAADRRVLTLTDHYLAYAEYGTSNPGVYLYDISTASTPTRIHAFTRTQCINMSSDTYNNVSYLAFDDQNSSCDVKLYNINTNTTTVIAATDRVEWWPVIQNGFVYYIKENRADTQGLPPIPIDPKPCSVSFTKEVKSYNISTATSSTIMSLNENETVYIVPNNTGANYVILDKTISTNNSDTETLYAYNQSSGNTTQIDTVSDMGGLCAVSKSCIGSKIVYTKYISSDLYNEDAYLYDISASTRTTICNNSNKQLHPRLGGERAIYSEFYIPDLYVDNWDNCTLKLYEYDLP